MINKFPLHLKSCHSLALKHSRVDISRPSQKKKPGRHLKIFPGPAPVFGRIRKKKKSQIYGNSFRSLGRWWRSMNTLDVLLGSMCGGQKQKTLSHAFTILKRKIDKFPHFSDFPFFGK